VVLAEIEMWQSPFQHTGREIFFDLTGLLRLVCHGDPPMMRFFFFFFFSPSQSSERRHQ
jgi:hypothetical protein